MKYRGHHIETDENKNWIFSGTKQLVSENKNINCAYCGGENTKEGHDKCLGTIKGVMNACCGHGIESDAYVQFSNSTLCIRGKEAIEYLKINKLWQVGGDYEWN